MRDFEPDDETLMRRIGERDATAFSQLYDRHADLIYSIALRVLADPALAQDAAQDVFLRLWRNPGAYDAARGRFVSWLVSVARNRAVDEVRMRGRRRLREIGENAAVDDPPDWRAEDPQVAVQVQADRLAVRRALAQLPAEQRVRVAILDASGRLVRELVFAHLPAGDRQLRWDGRDAAGHVTGAGVYFVSVTVGDQRLSAKAMRLR